VCVTHVTSRKSLRPSIPMIKEQRSRICEARMQNMPRTKEILEFSVKFHISDVSTSTLSTSLPWSLTQSIPDWLFNSEISAFFQISANFERFFRKYPQSVLSETAIFTDFMSLGQNLKENPKITSKFTFEQYFAVFLRKKNQDSRKKSKTSS